MKPKFFVIILVVFFSSLMTESAFGQEDKVLSVTPTYYLVEKATINHITNSGGNLKTFEVLTNGGTGVCINGWISFPLADAADSDIHKRAFSLALTAFLTKKPVTIIGTLDCNHAVLIDLHN